MARVARYIAAESIYFYYFLISLLTAEIIGPAFAGAAEPAARHITS